ncbi:hypothetical protein IIE_04860 [Bacillus cereus VD045]|nr:hypothetical protein IIE_04860 [Bacillus cereus VD045]
MQIPHVLYNNAPDSPAINPLLYSGPGITSCTVFQNIVFQAFDFELNNKVFP